LLDDPTAICREELRQKTYRPVPSGKETAFQLRRVQHQVMEATIEKIRNITPAAIARIPIHFQIPPSSPSSGVMSPASCFSALLSQKTPVVDLKYPHSTFPLIVVSLRFSIANPQ
jgi:hypothetical protein